MEEQRKYGPKRARRRVARRLLSRSSMVVALGTLAILRLLSPPASAHIVPPEKYHPVAESYRRLSFILNLNPVDWELAVRDVERIAAGMGELDAKKAEALRADTAVVFDSVLRVEDEAPGPQARKRAAKRLFEYSTRAVAELLTAHLEEASSALNDYKSALASLKEARQIWSSFEHEVKYTDPTAFREMGAWWLELTSSLGSPGFLTYAAVAADREQFNVFSERITDYVLASFGSEFSAPGNGRLAPLPRNSGSFDGRRVVPPKLPPGSNTNKQLPRPRQILNMAERGVDEGETVLIALGDMAFDSSFIFGEPASSLQITCNTCHNKSITNPNFIIPGLSAREGGMDVSNSYFAAHANNGHFDPLDIPDLRGIRFTAPYGRNGRFDSLREFVRNVIVNEFNGPEPDPVLMDGIIAYMIEFDFLANPALNADGSLNDTASEKAKRGEAIFHRPFPGMNGRSCASCHILSSNFLDHKRHDIGSLKGSSSFSRDRALDTPTLLGIKYTLPYFHDGSQPTLRAVNIWFSEQYELGLTGQEIDELTEYVATVGSGIEAYEDTVHTLDAEMEEFSFFLSAYEYLREIGKSDLIDITFQTIAQEIHAHKWDLQDKNYMSILNRMAGLMEEALASNQNGETASVDAIVAEYRVLYQEYASQLN